MMSDQSEFFSDFFICFNLTKPLSTYLFNGELYFALHATVLRLRLWLSYFIYDVAVTICQCICHVRVSINI